MKLLKKNCPEMRGVIKDRDHCIYLMKSFNNSDRDAFCGKSVCSTTVIFLKLGKSLYMY